MNKYKTFPLILILLFVAYACAQDIRSKNVKINTVSLKDTVLWKSYIGKPLNDLVDHFNIRDSLIRFKPQADGNPTICVFKVANWNIMILIAKWHDLKNKPNTYEDNTDVIYEKVKEEVISSIMWYNSDKKTTEFITPR